MRRFIVTKAQLKEYVDNKRTEKVFYDIVADLHETNKFLNESISKDKVNQSVIDNYNRKNLLTPEVNEMLIKYGVVNEKREII
jgi:hypothetical protein